MAISSWLVGIEADFQFSNIKDDASCLTTCGPQNFAFIRYNAFSVQEKLNWFGTVRGRVGYVAGPALIYATGGLAYGEVERIANLDGFNTIPTWGPFAGSYDNKKTKTGWTVGGGLEYKLPGAWSALSIKAEYLYIDLGEASDTLRLDYNIFVRPGATRTVTSDLKEQIVRVGFNYQFK